ncbi:SirB2 family protein [Pseudoxanthomonas suwonensis]
MIEFYPQIKLVHISAVMLSGSFFALRGLSLLAGLQWPRHALPRYLSYTIDTVLLTAALMLLTILPRELYANGWLLVKLGFVASYVVLGILAFRPRRGPASARGCWPARRCASFRPTASPAPTIRWGRSTCLAAERRNHGTRVPRTSRSVPGGQPAAAGILRRSRRGAVPGNRAAGGSVRRLATPPQ